MFVMKKDTSMAGIDLETAQITRTFRPGQVALIAF